MEEADNVLYKGEKDKGGKKDKARQYKGRRWILFQNQCSVTRDLNEIKDGVMKRPGGGGYMARQKEPCPQMFQEGTSLVSPWVSCIQYLNSEVGTIKIPFQHMRKVRIREAKLFKIISWLENIKTQIYTQVI